MKICCIIAEFNPFHAGHRFLLDSVRRAGAQKIVVIMSGNYVQRGEPAFIQKEYRVRAALRAGADLVAELPLLWSLSCADNFAHGGVFLADHAGGADTLCFGSETGDIKAIRSALAAADSPDDSGVFRSAMSCGLSYPAALSAAAAQADGAAAAVLSSPNDTLGAAYIRELSHIGSCLDPFCVKRQEGLPSAASIRESAMDAPLYDGCPHYSPERLSLCVLSRLRTMSAGDLRGIPEVSEGLEYRIRDCLNRSRSLDELLTLLKTRRYTMSRLKRIIMRAFVGADRSYDTADVPYFRVLGMRESGAALLGGIKLPLITRYSDVPGLNADGRRLFELECRASDLYGLLFDPALPCGREQAYGLISDDQKFVPKMQ